MKEKAILFGKHKSLIGIWTEPQAPDLAAGRPAVILLNAGVVHRIGPHRASVRIARRLAAESFLVVRFDLAGLGDSEPRRDTLSFQEGAVSDVIEAMDHLQKTRNIDEFVLMGLCSGADNSYQTACRDPRVVGALMMDGYSYPTPEFHVRRFLKRARHVSTWMAFARRKLDELERRVRGPRGEKTAGVAAAPPPSVTPGEPIRQYVREFPPKEQLRSEMIALVARGARLHFVYSCGMPQYYNYARQFMDSFRGVDFKGRVTSEFFAEADHTFTELKNQEALVAAIVRWMRTSFPTPGASTSRPSEVPEQQDGNPVSSSLAFQSLRAVSRS